MHSRCRRLAICLHVTRVQFVLTHWDLIFSDLIVFAMAFADRDRLGKGYLVGTIAMGLTLGVPRHPRRPWRSPFRVKERRATDPAGLDRACVHRALGG